MLRRYRFLLLAALGVNVMAGIVVHNGLPGAQPDVFDKSNQAKIDPFNELFKAPALDLTMEDKPAPAKKTIDIEVKPPRSEKVFNYLKFQVTSAPQQVKRGEVVRVTVTGSPRDGYHTFAMNVKAPGQLASVFKVGDTPGLKPLGPIQESAPVPVVEDGIGVWQQSNQFTWVFDVLVTPEARVGAAEFPFGVIAQVCKGSCFPPTEFPLSAEFTISPGDPVATAAEIQQRVKQGFPPAPVIKIPEGSSVQIHEPTVSSKIVGLPSDYQASIDRISKQIIGHAPGNPRWRKAAGR